MERMKEGEVEEMKKGDGMKEREGKKSPVLGSNQEFPLGRPSVP